ncbi:MAG: hypothetical protein KKA99_00060 [Gammaproteobacteria bacterium]|nr:hypothetical protein [Gammaproteobacteria bacterium]MBU2545684.1 hypothetical protein [Gammaproteobacteria bacterium]
MTTIADAIRIVREGSDKEVIDVVIEISNDSDLLLDLFQQAKTLQKKRLQNAQVMPDNAKDLKELIAKHPDQLLWFRDPEDPNGNQHPTNQGMWSADTSTFEITEGLVPSAPYTTAAVFSKSAKKAKSIGDTHADFCSSFALFIRAIRDARKPGHIRINHGDVIDRGEHSTENGVFYLLQMLTDPENFLCLQGNHESAYYMSAHWETKNCFGEQLRKKFDEATAKKLFNGFGELYSLLPIFAFGNDLQFIASHAGPPRLEEKYVTLSLEEILEEGVTPLSLAKKFISLKRKEGCNDYWLETWGDPVCVEMDSKGQFVRNEAGQIQFYPIDDKRNKVPEYVKTSGTFPNAARIGLDVDLDSLGDDIPQCFTQFCYEKYKEVVDVEKVVHVRGHSLPLSLVPNDILPNSFLFQSTGEGGLDAYEDFKKKIIPTWGEIDLKTLSVETKKLYAGCDHETLSEIVLAFVYFYLKDKGVLARQEDVLYDAEQEAVTFFIDQESVYKLSDLERQLKDMLEFYKYIVSFRYGKMESVKVCQQEKTKEVYYVPVSIMIPKNGASRLENCVDLAKQFVDKNRSFFVEGMETNYSVDSKTTYDQIIFSVAMGEVFSPDFLKKIRDFVKEFSDINSVFLETPWNREEDDNFDAYALFDVNENLPIEETNECCTLFGVPSVAWERFSNGDTKTLENRPRLRLNSH